MQQARLSSLSYAKVQVIDIIFWPGGLLTFYNYFIQFSSVAQSCPTLCDPMDCSTPGFPVRHQPPELAQTYTAAGDDRGAHEGQLDKGLVDGGAW